MQKKSAVKASVKDNKKKLAVAKIQEEKVDSADEVTTPIVEKTAVKS